MWHAILDFFGVVDEGGKGYGFWSGIGSDIGEVAIIGAVVGMYRKHSCHVDGCWRIGKHSVQGTGFVTCRKHHPTISSDVPLTAEDIAQAHDDAQAAGRQPA
jgi:hypothetical protein